MKPAYRSVCKYAAIIAGCLMFVFGLIRFLRRKNVDDGVCSSDENDGNQFDQ